MTGLDYEEVKDVYESTAIYVSNLLSYVNEVHIPYLVNIRQREKKYGDGNVRKYHTVSTTKKFKKRL